jgi:hypothetical protein
MRRLRRKLGAHGLPVLHTPDVYSVQHTYVTRTCSSVPVTLISSSPHNCGKTFRSHEDRCHTNSATGWFIWRGNIFRVAQSTLYLAQRAEGLGLIDVRARRIVFFIKLLNPTGHVMRQQFNIQQLYVLLPNCIYVFCIYLRTNSDF